MQEINALKEDTQTPQAIPSVASWRQQAKLREITGFLAIDPESELLMQCNIHLLLDILHSGKDAASLYEGSITLEHNRTTTRLNTNEHVRMPALQDLPPTSAHAHTSQELKEALQDMHL